MVKSKSKARHNSGLYSTFKYMRVHNLKMVKVSLVYMYGTFQDFWRINMEQRQIKPKQKPSWKNKLFKIRKS